MSRRLPLVLLLLVGAACGQGPRQGPGPPPPGRFARGIVFGLFARDEPRHARRGLDEIKALGADSVSIVIPWVTRDVRATTLAPREDMTPRDGALRRAIREAHRRGMSVFLMPLLYVDEMGEGEWRGTLAPADWPAWWAAYTEFILHYARLAEEEGVAFLSVGSELCSTEERRADWLALIGRVRASYRGALTYSSNWDHLEPLSFADALDYLGMNAYYEIAPDPETDEEAMKAAWRGIRDQVETWRAGKGLPLIFTEVGYPSRKGGATDPWNYTIDADPDPDVQERAYRAFVETWAGYPHLAGVYFYMWWGDGGVGDTGYTPRGKPAEKVVSSWFREP